MAEHTGLSERFWQRRIKEGAVPGVMTVTTGKREVHRVSSAVFIDYFDRMSTTVGPVEKPILRRRETPRRSSSFPLPLTSI